VVGGEAKRPWLGIVGLSLNRQIARYYGLPIEHGVLVSKIAEGNPADEAGLAEGDIILKIDEVETSKIEDLVNEIHKKRIGDSVRILAIRNGRGQFFMLKLSQAP